MMGKRIGRMGLVSALVAVAGMTAGCATQEVKPWQRGALAKSEMAWEVDPLLGDLQRHTQFSKEAASGDATLGGGGCGCN
jgi:hypothetical protein